MEDFSGIDLMQMLANAADHSGISRTKLIQEARISSKTMAKINRGGDVRDRRQLIEDIAAVIGLTRSQCADLGRPLSSPTKADRVRGDIECSIDSFLARESEDFLAEDLAGAVRRSLADGQLLRTIGLANANYSLILPPDWLAAQIRNPGRRPPTRFRTAWAEPLLLSLAADMVGPIAAAYRLSQNGQSATGIFPFDLTPYVHGVSGAQQVAELIHGKIDAHFAVLGLPSRTIQNIGQFRLLIPLYKRQVHTIVRWRSPLPRRLLYGEGGFGELFHRSRNELALARSTVETNKAKEGNPLLQAERLNEGEGLLTIDPFVGRLASLLDGNGKPRFKRAETKFEVTVGLFVNTAFCPDTAPDPAALQVVKNFTQAFLDAYAEGIWDRGDTRTRLMENQQFVRMHAATVGLPS